MGGFLDVLFGRHPADGTPSRVPAPTGALSSKISHCIRGRRCVRTFYTVEVSRHFERRAGRRAMKLVDLVH